jgi:hypothetical protein
MIEVLANADFALLLRLLIAHLLGDFVFQRKSWIIKRQQEHWKAGSLYLHALIIGVLTYIFSGQYNNVWLPVVIMITHLLTDLWKSYTDDNLQHFILDQFIHFAVIIIAWYFYTTPDFNLFDLALSVFRNPSFLVIIISYIFVIWPSGFLIAKITKPWQDQVETNKGLTDAGRWIGILERILILTFILLHQFVGIGFLIAAKSILRFGDIKNPDNRKEAEYILLGTMVSFIVAIFTGVIALYLMNA